MRPTRRSPETLIFTGATAIALLHALDDAFLHGRPGVGFGHYGLAAAIALVAGLAGIAAFPSLRAGLRAALAFTFGSFALVNGVLHARHIASDGIGRGDLTGVAVLLAGATLIGLAACIPWRERGEGRWRGRALAVGGFVLGMFLLIVPIGMAIVDTHKFRGEIGAPPSAAYEPVSFRSTDGLELAGWFLPSRNGATVLVEHGGGSDRMGSVAHARLLARHGYGVLLYDARGGGESEGVTSGYGYGREKDTAGALDYLRGRADVDGARVGALGLSTGADILLDVAAERHDLKAVVTDGAAALSHEDWRRVRGDKDLGWAPGFVMFKAVEVLSGDRPNPPLEDEVARMTSPLLIISADRLEMEFGDVYERAAGGPVEHWRVPDGQHTALIRERAAEYERRVIGFLDRTLR